MGSVITANIINFYSLKGGTGRSLALVNTAYRMAQLGKRVLCLDLDIEAPGLLDLFGIDEREVSLTTMQLLENGGDEIFRILSNGTSNVFDVGEKFNDQSLKGKIFLIPALRESLNHIMKIVREKIDTRDYYTMSNDTIRTALSALNSALALDYILIDSRSGVSKEAIYSLFLSNDKIVLNTRLDKQGRAGIEYVYRVLKSRFEQLGVNTILIASNVPTDIPDEVNTIIKDIEDRVDDRIHVVIPHDSKLMLNEEIVVKTRPESDVAKQFNNLAKILITEE